MKPTAIHVRSATYDVNCTTNRIRSPKHRTLSANDFNMVHHSGVNCVEVLIWPKSENGVVQADAIHQNQNLLPRDATQKRGRLTSCRTLHQDSNFLLKCFEHIDRLSLDQVLPSCNGTGNGCIKERFSAPKNARAPAQVPGLPESQRRKIGKTVGKIKSFS